MRRNRIGGPASAADAGSRSTRPRPSHPVGELVADARHSWLDALSSLGTLLGLGLVALGFRWGDPVAGLAVTLFILHVGYEVTGEILHHLMDGVDASELEGARLAASKVAGPDVVVRDRWMVRSLRLEVDLPVSADARLGEVEAI